MDNPLNIGKHDDIDDNEAVVQALTICTSFMLPVALNVAIQLNVFDIIIKSGDGAHLTASEIASQLPTSSLKGVRMLESVLRLLANNSFLTSSTKNLGNGKMEICYGLGSVGKCFVGDDTLAPFHTLQFLSTKMEYLFNLKDAVLEDGDLYKKHMGESMFEYANSNPEFGDIFNNAMTNHSVVIMRKVVEVYKGFEGLSSIVNVGGGYGVALDMIISKYPSIHGINFDLPEVIKNAPPYKDHGLKFDKMVTYNGTNYEQCHEGIEHVGGDMFVEVPRADAIFLKFVLHNWNDEKCISLLSNCYKSLPNNGKLIVMDCILPDHPKSDVHSEYAYQMDVLMAATYGAKERTEDEFKEFAKRVGFSTLNVICYVHGLWVMEFLKLS